MPTPEQTPATVKQSVLKALPPLKREDMDAMQPAALKAEIVQASARIAQVDLDALANEKYQELKAAAKEAGAGYAEAKKVQRAVIAYALARLDESGAIDLTDVDGTGGEVGEDEDGEEVAA